MCVVKSYLLWLFNFILLCQPYLNRYEFCRLLEALSLFPIFTHVLQTNSIYQLYVQGDGRSAATITVDVSPSVQLVPLSFDIIKK